MSGLFAFVLSFLLSLFLPWRGGRDPLDHRRSPVDIPSVSAVASTLTWPRPTIYGMSGGRTSASLDPLLRGVDEHADFKIDPAFPSPFYVGCSVQCCVEQQCQEFSVLDGGLIPMGRPLASVSTALRRNNEPC